MPPPATLLLTHDSMQFLAPRFEAMRDGLRALPGATVVADIAASPVSQQGGYDMMATILLANPNIDVVLGALRDAGKARPDQFLGGIDGEPEAVVEIMQGDSPRKASIALNSPVFGYAMRY